MPRSRAVTTSGFVGGIAVHGMTSVPNHPAIAAEILRPYVTDDVYDMIAYAKAAEEHKVKLECECFQTGAFWHLDFVRKAGYLKKQTYVTLFIGWPGGTWMPPTERALQFFVDNLPGELLANLAELVVGEDEVTVGNNRFVHHQYGGSASRWGSASGCGTRRNRRRPCPIPCEGCSIASTSSVPATTAMRART